MAQRHNITISMFDPLLLNVTVQFSFIALKEPIGQRSRDTSLRGSWPTISVVNSAVLIAFYRVIYI